MVVCCFEAIRRVRLSAAVVLSLATSSLGAELNIAQRESEFYRIITLPIPTGLTLEAGALQFLGPDKLAVSTRLGDIYIVTGVLSGPPRNLQWTQFASGLHEVLGLAYRDGWIYATQRGEVTNIKDENGDGRADIFETLGDSCLDPDPDGLAA